MALVILRASLFSTLVLLPIAGCAPSPPAHVASAAIVAPDASAESNDPSTTKMQDVDSPRAPEDAPQTSSAESTPPSDGPPVSAPPTTSSQPPPPPPPPQPTAAERKACAARGGKIQPVCMLGNLECVIRFRDGGKKCTDKKDCTGECLFEGSSPPASGHATGACQRTSDPCGCKVPIVGGKVQPGICVD